MKRLLSAIVIILLTASCAIAASNITFQWNANTETDLAGYNIYQSDASALYPGAPVAIIPAGQTTHTLENISDGTYFWVMTAFDTDGNESNYSNEVTVTLDTTAPATPTMTISVIVKVTIE